MSHTHTHLFFFFIIFIFLLSLSAMAMATTTTIIGVTLNPNSPNLPPIDRIVSSLHSSGVSHLLLIDPSPYTLRSFLYSPISILLSLPSNLSSSSSSSYTLYLSHHLLPFHPRLHISALLLPFHHNHNNINISSSFETLRYSLSSLGLPSFPISTILPFRSLLSPSFPPSAARFRSPTLIRPLLHFLNSTNSPLLLHLFPFHLYVTQSNIPIGFAMFDSQAFAFRNDPGSGLRYRNLFDQMLDSVFTALDRIGYGDLPVVVAGTGWPTGGQTEATVEYAERYNWGVAEHVRSGLGTPMRRGGGLEGVYIQEVFDDNDNDRGEEWERHWGIWYRNLSPKYDVGFLRSGRDSGNMTKAVMVAVWWSVVVVVAAVKILLPV